MDYANKVMNDLKDAGIRTEIDDRAEKIGYKIREARLQKIPYMLVVGAKEGAKDLNEFIDSVKEEIKNRENRKVEVTE